MCLSARSELLITVHFIEEVSSGSGLLSSDYCDPSSLPHSEVVLTMLVSREAKCMGLYLYSSKCHIKPHVRLLNVHTPKLCLYSGTLKLPI